MDMLTWAEKEVEIACARERAVSTEDGEWDYGCACYQSALKAFKSLAEDGHSGYSIGITKHILVRLIEGKPLTPIEDTPDIWNDIIDRRPDGTVEYQCKRMSALFKTVHPDGTVTYSDVDRVICFNVNDPDLTYTNGFIRRLIEEMYPVEMPYWAGKPFIVAVEDFLTDPKNADFDTMGVLYFTRGDERQEINRFFQESKDGWDEISKEEYLERKLISEKLKESNNA
jgi:hypothetical protein